MITKEFTESEIREMDAEEISAESWRHGRRATFVFTDNDGHNWQFTADVHHSEGLQLYGPVTCTKVHQVERKVLRWEPVP